MGPNSSIFLCAAFIMLERNDVGTDRNKMRGMSAVHTLCAVLTRRLKKVVYNNGKQNRFKDISRVKVTFRCTILVCSQAHTALVKL